MQIETRTLEADSAEKLTLIFWSVIHTKMCAAIDDSGEPCTGIPTMKACQNKEGFCMRKNFDWCVLDGGGTSRLDIELVLPQIVLMKGFLQNYFPGRHFQALGL